MILKVCLIILFCSLANASLRIFGGSEVAPGSNIEKSTVGLGSIPLHGKGTALTCSGTLIDKDLVLTAAHCVHNAVHPQIPKKIIFGVKAEVFPQAILSAVAIKRHESYIHGVDTPENNRNDLALILLETSSPEGFVPAVLPPHDHYPVPSPVSVAGFGASFDHFDDKLWHYGVLKSTQLSVERVEYENKLVYFEQSQNTGACYGDSGGPLYEQTESLPLRVLGIVSGGTDYDCTKGESYFVLVSEHLDWIKATTAELRALVKK